VGTRLCSETSRGVPSANLWLEPTEDMALRNDDRDWIHAEIQSAVDLLRPHGWRKAVFVLRELGPLTATVAIIVALVGITLGAVYQSTAHVKEETTFRTNTMDRLGTIEGTLKLLQAQIAVAKYSSAPPQELKKHHDELASVRATLASAPKSEPDFWPVTFQVINLLSQATSNPTVQNEQKESVMDTVVSNPPGGMTPVMNSRVVLKNLVAGVTFINSIVRFDPSVRLANDTFINCIFVFPTEANPPKNLQEIGSELLAADLSHATVKGS
jgi:hypothetical protein